MNKSKAGKLARRLFTLLVLVACLMLVRGEPAATSAPCTWPRGTDAPTECLNRNGFWTFICCACAEEADIAACAAQGLEWNVCTRQCVPPS